MVSTLLSSTGSSMIGPSLPPGWKAPSDGLDVRDVGNVRIYARPSTSNRASELPTGPTAHAGSMRKPIPLPPVRLTWQPGHQGVGCGLKNLGNSCYLNSILQCLAYLPPLGQRCTSHMHVIQCPRKADGRIDCVACIVEGRLSRCLHGSPGNAEAPQRLWNHLPLISKELRRGAQEDAHEALRFLVEAVHRDQLRAAYGWNFKPSPKEKEPTTPISQLFQGEVQSQVRCMVCHHSSNRLETTMDLSLEVHGCRTVYEALDKFTEVERLDGDNKYQCDKCERLVPARKQMTIKTAPHCLVVHLKRFDILGGKIGSMVSFPEQLSLCQYLSSGAQEGQPPAEYRLCTVTIHEGSTRMHGHYHAMVQDPTGAWYNMDDCTVTRASRQEVLAQRAYLLFYVRRAGAVAAVNGAVLASHTQGQGPSPPPKWAPRALGKRPQTIGSQLPEAKVQRVETQDSTAPAAPQTGPSLPPSFVQERSRPVVIGPQLPRQSQKPQEADPKGSAASCKGETYEPGGTALSEAEQRREQLKAKVRQWCRSGPLMRRVLKERPGQPGSTRVDTLWAAARAAVVDRPEELLGVDNLRRALTETEHFVDSLDTASG